MTGTEVSTFYQQLNNQAKKKKKTYLFRISIDDVKICKEGIAEDQKYCAYQISFFYCILMHPKILRVKREDMCSLLVFQKLFVLINFRWLF
jgi:hypothetical protein